MEIQMKFREPVKLCSAVELSKMPLTVMNEQIDDQERHARKEDSMSADAMRVLLLMRDGHRITASGDGLRFSYAICGQKIKPAHVYQLERRGYISRSDLGDGGENAQ